MSIFMAHNLFHFQCIKDKRYIYIYNIDYLRHIKVEETNEGGPSKHPSETSITDCVATMQRR